VLREEYQFPSYDSATIVIYRYWTNNDLGASPALPYIHGGGFILGNVEMCDKAIRQLVKETGVQTFAVEYRLAPEHAHPTPTEDCFSALCWIHAHASKFSIDNSRIGLFGVSAGGGLAAGTALLARDRELMPPVAKQILIYPMLDDQNVHPIDGIEKLAIWNSDDNLTGWTALMGDRREAHEGRQYGAPIHAKDLKNLPSTYMDVGGLDIFASECQQYAHRLSLSNVEVEFHLYPGVPHLFDVFAPHINTTKRAMESWLRAVRSI
jgi:acetyl esterase/lipase